MSAPNIPSSISTFVTPYRTNNAFITLNTPFVPTQIPNLGLWLDASDVNANGSQPADNTAVTTWVDKSSNGFNATQATASYRPTYSNNGVIFSNDNFDPTVVNGLSSTYPSTRYFETIFVVLNQTRNATDANANLNIIRPSAVGGGTGRAIYIDSNNILNTGIAVSATSNRSMLPYVTVPLDKTSLITSWNSNGVNIDHYVNGYNISSIVSTTSNYSSAPGTTTLFGTNGTYVGSNGYNGILNEVIIYSSTLTSNQVFNVQNYLMQKWSITSLSESNFSPNQFQGLAAWYDSADIYGNNTNPPYGTSMSNWIDKSGNTNTLIQGTTELEPTFTEDGVFFSNTNNNTTSNGFQLPYKSPGGSETIFIAMKSVPIASSNSQFIISCELNVGRSILLSSVTTMATIESAIYAQDPTLAAGRIQQNNVTLLTMTNLNNNTTSNLSHYINGNLVGTVLNTASVASTSNHYIGYNINLANSNNGFNGSIYEIIMYSNLISSNQRNFVEYYLRQKWSYNLNSNNMFAVLNNIKYPLVQQYVLPSYNQLLPNSYQSTIYIQSAGPVINTLNYPLVSSFLSTAGIYRSKNVPF